MSRPDTMLQGSGDLLADRRYAYAEAALADGDAEAARDLYTQSLERVAGWLPAWLGLARADLALNRIDDAIASFRRIAANDPGDLLGARAYLARLGAADGALTPGYVSALFDDYAPRFDAHLTMALDYRAPEILAEALSRVSGDRSFRRALDLGCGTGLMAKALEGRVQAVLGVDLSERMLDIARRTGLYSQLDTADCTDWLAEMATDSADLVVAADVFCYMEHLEPVFGQVFRVLEKAGLFAFTIQTNAEPGMRVGDDLRVHHNPSLIRDIARQTGFLVALEEPTSVRRDRGLPVPGTVFVLEHRDEVTRTTRIFGPPSQSDAG
jgi:predicted TPR repeat methyltransferase